jgi:peptide deformylase
MPEYKGEIPSFDLHQLIKKLKVTRKAYGGIGLSANQCGIKARVFVLGYEDTFDMVCINPKVLEISEDIINDNEGCLSFPGLYLKVKRPSKIKVEYTAEDGKVTQVELTGLTARCYLHELDHMNGVKFTDYVGPLALKIAKEKQQKRIKKHTRMAKK